MGRVSKMPKFLKAMKKVLEDPRTVTATDKELWVLTNKRLKKKDRISMDTFNLWKKPSNCEKSPVNQASVSTEMLEDFQMTLDYARAEMKMNLTGNMLDENNKNQWGASWILERKYDDMKLNKPQQLSLGDGQFTINILPPPQPQIEEITIDIPHIEKQPTKLEEYNIKKDNGI